MICVKLFGRYVNVSQNQGCSLGLETCFSKISVSGNLGGSRSRSRLGLKTKRLGLVSVLKLKVSFTSESFLTVKLLIQNKLSSSVRVSHNHNLSVKKANVGYLFIPNDSFF